ncbi:hypothetical protein CFK37_18960 [Virgibacillus phasianinus]|uniref:Uncharacterized protein n=1 Tax=Virgibacillus phasianinus TaxID=2017483 RepID=A0A220U7R6_9BACI|nr:hypothetical protein [Virgibacillus phasianinus]ASK64085.1 hypothetical protein CFK37_18960 [Virgibacillus phasianinus]
MKQHISKLTKIIGWILFLLAIAAFCVQLGFLYVDAKFQATYIDNRLFYIINIFCIFSLVLAVLVLLRLTKRFKIVLTSIVVVFIVVQAVMLIGSNQEIKNITSVSPDWKHVLSIKENTETGNAVYYRSYYGILARPKEKLPYETSGEFKVEWLAKDVAAVTYKTADNTIQQYVGTYGDRGSGRSYYYVGAEIHGKWQGNNIEVISDTKGITVTENGESELFDWDSIHQFGTLAVVLKKNDEAVWTISLNENFEVHSAASEKTVGTISLYKATMGDSQPIILRYKGSN